MIDDDVVGCGWSSDRTWNYPYTDQVGRRVALGENC